MTHRSHVHGLTVASPVAIAGVRPDPDVPVDLHVTIQVGALVEPRDTTLLAQVADPATGRSYRLQDHGSGWTFAFDGTAVVVMEADQLRATIAPGVSDEQVSVLLSGPVLAAAAMRDGRVLLHASAVATAQGDGDFMAFVGPAGRGKSTVAALLSAAGRPLVSDDALAVDVAGPGVWAWPGTTRSRLRSAGLVDGPVGRSPDGRVVIDGQATTSTSRRPVVLVVEPRLSAEYRQVAVEEVSSTEALLTLVTTTPVDGLCDPRLLRSHFEGCAELVQRVPFVRLRVPWVVGGRVPTSVVDDIDRALRDVRLACGSEVAGAPA